MSKSSAASAASSSGAPATESALLATVKTASEKPALARRDGLAALVTLLCGSWANSAQNPTAARVLGPLLRENQSFVNHYAAINEENIAAFCAFYPPLLRHHAPFLAKHALDAPTGPLFVTLVRLTLHASYKIRRSVTSMLSEVLASLAPAQAEALQGALLRTFQLLVHSKNAAALAPPNASYVWSHSLLTLAAHPFPALMPLTLLLAHHPLLSNPDARSWRSSNNTFDALRTVWASRSAALTPAAAASSASSAVAAVPGDKKHRNIPLKDREAVLLSVSAQIPAIQKLLFSNQGLLPAVGTLAPAVASSASSGPAHSPAAAAAAAAAASASAAAIVEVDEATRSELQRAASVGLLLSLFRAFPQLSLDTLFAPLIDLLAHPDFDKLSAADIAIYNTPEGVLCDFVAAGEFKAVVVERPKRPADWTERDEELERRAAEKRAKDAAAAASAKRPGPGGKGAPGKPGAKAAPLTGAEKAEADRRKKLDDQAAVRAKLTAAKHQVEPVLRFFSQLAIRQPMLVHQSVLPELLPRIYALFGNEIVRDAALQTHRDLLACVDVHVAAIGSCVSLALQAVQLRGATAFTDTNTKRLIARTLAELRTAARKRPFSAHTFLYIAPLLESTIAHSADLAAADLKADAEDEDEDDDEEEKAAAAPAPKKRIDKLGAADDDDEDEEEFDEQEEEEEEDQPAEEEKGKEEDTEASPLSPSSDERDDTERPLAPGLQLGLLSASEVLNLHCAPDLHLLPAAAAAAAAVAGAAAAPATPFPVARMYSSLLHILARINTLHKTSLDALLSLSSASGITSAQTLPLLSEQGVLSPRESVRLNALQACELLQCFAPDVAVDRVASVAHFELFTQRMWIACHDSKADVSARAAAIWTQFDLHIGPQYLDELIALLRSEEAVIRTAVGSAIASALARHPAEAQPTLRKMMDLFIASPDEVVSANALGLRQNTEYIDRHRTRSGVAQALAACSDASVHNEVILRDLFAFFTSAGLRDMNDRVWEDVLNATLRVINQHGQTYMHVLLPMLEEILRKDFERQAARDAAAAAPASSASSGGGKKGKGVAASAPAAAAFKPMSEEEELQNDRLREGVILSMGTLARHMEEGDEHLVSVVDSLIECLRTPAHSVQKSVSECLAPLMAFQCVSDQAARWIDLLLDRLRNAEDYGERIGAAFGLAGCVKGLKLASLKKYNILDQLAAMVQDKTSARARQGALFAYERLFFELGSRFEPYVVHILPHLLACYGDTNQDVRAATQAAARMVMSHLTSHGIKMVLPLVLKALNEKAWRTKLESIGLLSAMAYCSPQQLSACLPMIVPRLLEVMTDPNAKVQTASKAALRQIGSVIRAPEILTLVPVLLNALNDPTTHTRRALHELMRTSFVHSVDPPSLALIIPILKKGLKGRTGATKKMSAQVIGSMCSLVGDVKDILPYASTLLKNLKIVLCDPNPEVRAVAARALAALYKGVIEEEAEGFPELREYLLDTLRSDNTTPTIRSGCAQGLAQLLAVQGLEATSQLLPSLFAETKSDRAVVREGFFNLFGFLPEAFQQIFSIFVADVLPVIVAGLADEIGLVREAALAAGQSLVLNFAQSKTDLLLPALEDGIVSSDWRIRLSSVQLLGVMLLRLSGCSIKLIVGANAAEEGEGEEKNAATICTREQENHIESVLGTDRRNRLLSTVYLMRCDVVPAVADLAYRVWKSIVSNSPRMLTTILPVLMSLIISDLASTKEERQQAAGRTLGELVHKMGDYILAEIVPILQARLSSDDKFTRQGVCLGLSEVMASSRKADLAAYMADLVPSVRDALCDPEELVRAAAGKCFTTTLRCIGRRAVDDVIPALLWRLDQEEGDEYKAGLVLEGMRVVLSINSNDVLPYLIPALIKSPFTLFHAKALAFLSVNITKGFIKYVESVTQALIDGMARSPPEQMADMRVACAQVVLCVSQDCVSTFCTVLEETSTSSKDPAVRGAVAHLIAAFASNTKTNYESQVPLLLQILLRLFIEEGELLQAAWEALEAMMKCVPEDKQARHITFVRSVLSDLAFDQFEGRRRAEIPGFCLKKGIAPLLPMFQHGLMHGTPPQRVEAAEGLADIVNLTSEAALAPFVIKITGPLIRIVGDRFPADVKSAILHTLYLLIVKCARHLKPFLPQLVTTFIKSLSDPNALVRSRGGAALAELVTEAKRATSVLTELSGTVASDVNPALKTSALQAMVGVSSNKAVAGTLAPETVTKLVGLAEQYLSNDRESVRRQCARLMAVNAPFLPDADLDDLVQNHLLKRPLGIWADKDGVLCALQALARTCSAKISIPLIVKFASSFLSDAHEGALCAAILTLGECLLQCAAQGQMEEVVSIAGMLVPQLQSELPQVRVHAASRFQLLGEASADAAAAVYDVAVPALLSRSADPNALVRNAVACALHTLFQFHTSDGADRGEKLLGVFHARLLKRDAAAATALQLFVKKSVAKAKLAPVADELWASTQQGESLADPNAAPASAAASSSGARGGDSDDE